MSHLFLPSEGDAAYLMEELRRMWPQAFLELNPGGWVECGVETREEAVLQPVVFARQALPSATDQSAPSINAWAKVLLDASITRLPADQPWRLHVLPHYGEGRAGENRCRLIREAFLSLLKQKRRQLLRLMEESDAPFAESTSVVQLLLTSPEHGFLSVSIAPQPHLWRAVMSPFPKGEIPIAEDKSAPSRAFTKLVESTRRLGREIAPDETCVDLGASPGSWSYVALNRGAQVIAVDRSPLRDDLMRHRRLRFVQGDAFKFVPEDPVDWLLCDVIAEPHRSIGLVSRWVAEKRCRHFIVTIKFKGDQEYALMDALKKTLPPLCKTFILTRLCANKNEACVIGSLASDR